MFRGFTCPLTPLEQWLRGAGGDAAWSGGFIDHYIATRLQSSGLSHQQWIWLGVALLAFNALVYGRVLARLHRRGG